MRSYFKLPKSRHSVVILILNCVLFGCASPKSDISSSLSFSDYSVITIPKDYDDFTKVSPSELHVERMNLWDVAILNDLLCVESTNADGYVTVLDKNSYSLYGHYLRQGRGPNEILYMPALCNVTKEDGFLHLFNYGQLLKIDIDESLKAGSIVGFKEKESLSTSITSYLYLSDSLTIGRLINAQVDGQDRFLIVNRVKTDSEQQMELNIRLLDKKGDGVLFNLLGSRTGYSKERDIVVEASLMLNTINMYSLFSDYAHTISIGGEPDNFHELESRYGRIGDTFLDYDQHDDYFAVLYNKDNRQKFIFFFDWTGALARTIKVPNYVQAFAVDDERSLLYAVDRDGDRLLYWQLSE